MKSFKKRLLKKVFSNDRFMFEEDGELVVNDHNLYLMNYVQYLCNASVDYKGAFVGIVNGLIQIALAVGVIVFSPVLFFVFNYIDFKKHKKRILEEYSEEELNKIKRGYHD